MALASHTAKNRLQAGFFSFCAPAAGASAERFEQLGLDLNLRFVVLQLRPVDQKHVVHAFAQGARAGAFGHEGVVLVKTGAHGNPVLFLHPKDFDGTLIELEEVR